MYRSRTDHSAPVFPKVYGPPSLRPFLPLSLSLPLYRYVCVCVCTYE